MNREWGAFPRNAYNNFGYSQIADCAKQYSALAPKNYLRKN